MEKVKAFFRKIGAWIKKHKITTIFMCFMLILVIVALTSCQGLANVNGSGNTMVIGRGNDTKPAYIDSFNSADTEITESFN